MAPSQLSTSMAQVKNPMGGISILPPVATAAVVTPAPDVESQLRQEHTAAEQVGDECDGREGAVISAIICVSLVVLINIVVAIN
jgi:hypothetical protein